MKRIALFLPNWIGDAVMATPAIRAVRDQFPRAHLISIGKPFVSAALDGSPWFDEVIFHDKRGPAELQSRHVIRRLRKRAIDAAILFPNSFRSALIALLGGCKRRIGFARYARNMLLTDRLYATRGPGGTFKPVPIINDYNLLVSKLGLSPSLRMELFTTPADERQANAIWDACGLHDAQEVICLNSGGAFGASKHWPIASFAELARQLVDVRGAKVLVLCGPEERTLAKEIVEKSQRAQVFSLADRVLSLGLTKACVRRCDLLITTDSGPRHFAQAFDRPVITLFGPTHIEWTETYFPRAVHLQKKVPCGPCQLRVCPLDHRCMRDLQVKEVFDAANGLLKKYPARDRRIRYAG